MIFWPCTILKLAKLNYINKISPENLKRMHEFSVCVFAIIVQSRHMNKNKLYVLIWEKKYFNEITIRRLCVK